ncbi:hypothetical protein WP50_28890, partial [Lactiplantibacillus plantarum]
VEETTATTETSGSEELANEQVKEAKPAREPFFSFLGDSIFQLKHIKAQPHLTIAMMSMSCVTASILGAYIKMMPGQFILTAVPMNVLNAAIIAAILNPVEVKPEEDTIAKISGSAAVEETTATTVSC